MALLLIGVRNPELPTALYARVLVRLKELYPERHVEIMDVAITDPVDAAEDLALLEDLLARPDYDVVLWFYCHGTREGNFRFGGGALVAYDRVLQLLSQNRCNTVSVVADCCYAGELLCGMYPVTVTDEPEEPFLAGPPVDVAARRFYDVFISSTVRLVENWSLVTTSLDDEPTYYGREGSTFQRALLALLEDEKPMTAWFFATDAALLIFADAGESDAVNIQRRIGSTFAAHF